MFAVPHPVDPLPDGQEELHFITERVHHESDTTVVGQWRFGAVQMPANLCEVYRGLQDRNSLLGVAETRCWSLHQS